MWESDRFCSGGESFSVSKPVIQASDDPTLFLSGRRGIFHCKFPMAPGLYEVHLLFAETAGLQENARTVGFSLNGGSTNSLDVVDDAGQGDAATTKVFTDVEPESDGSIHLDFTTPDSFLNAVEIMPGVPHRMLPVRIVAGRRSSYRDLSGNLWLPDRYHFGGEKSGRPFLRVEADLPTGRPTVTMYASLEFGQTLTVSPPQILITSLQDSSIHGSGTDNLTVLLSGMHLTGQATCTTSASVNMFTTQYDLRVGGHSDQAQLDSLFSGAAQDFYGLR